MKFPVDRLKARLKTLLSKPADAELVIRPRYAPHTKLLIATIAAVLVLAGIGLAYNHGLQRAGLVRTTLDERADSLRDEARTLESENQNLREALARASRALQMNETTFTELDRALKESAREIAGLREELGFYRNLASPAARSTTLQVQRFTLQRASGDNSFRYKIVVVQTRKQDRPVTGEIRVLVTGTRRGKQETLTVTGAGAAGTVLKLRTMQEVEGELRLPDGFKPAQIKVSVRPTNVQRPVVQYFTWPQV